MEISVLFFKRLKLCSLNIRPRCSLSILTHRAPVYSSCLYRLQQQTTVKCRRCCHNHDVPRPIKSPRLLCENKLNGWTSSVFMPGCVQARSYHSLSAGLSSFPLFQTASIEPQRCHKSRGKQSYENEVGISVFICLFLKHD